MTVMVVACLMVMVWMMVAVEVMRAAEVPVGRVVWCCAVLLCETLVSELVINLTFFV